MYLVAEFDALKGSNYATPTGTVLTNLLYIGTSSAISQLRRHEPNG